MSVALACLPSTAASTGMQSCISSVVDGVADELLLQSSFSYEPLQEGEIRLLRLLPGSSEMEVRCELIQLRRLPILDYIATAETNTAKPNGSDGSIRVILQTQSISYLAEEYEALSYTWDTETFPVTANLESALRHLRCDLSSRTLWVDAICINQKNAAEKEQQVKAMHQIYDRAQQVIVWLGPESANSDMAMTFAQEIYRCFDAASYWIEDELQFYLLDPNERSEKVASLLVAERASAWVALHRLLSRRWWGRAWILQELLVAKRAIVCCGKSKIPWSVMSLAISVCRVTYHSVLDLEITVDTLSGVYQYDWPGHFVETCFDIVARRGSRLENDPRTSPHPENLSTWLSGNRHRSCHLPHDKIYSILGLLNPTFQAAIQPSYTVDVITLYKAVVKAYIESSGRIDLICHSQHSVWQFDKPSWMPDWGRHERAVIFAEIAGFELRNSPLFDSARATFSDDLNILTVRGTCIGQIQGIELEYSMLSNLKKQWWDNSGSCVTKTADHRPDHHQVSEAGGWWYFEACAKKLFEPALDTLPLDDEEWDNHLNLLFEMIRLLLYPSSSDWYQRREADNEGYEPDIQSSNAFFEIFYAHLQGLLKSRTIFETLEQEIGVAPDFAEPGDWVCMLFGCRVPVILRRREDDSFMFVGDAYIYQATDGDILKELHAERCQLRNFSLS